MIYDYAVIGAGPAGSFMTYLLQKNGYKTILLVCLATQNAKK